MLRNIIVFRNILWLLSGPLPDIYAMSGVALVVVGMLLHSYYAIKLNIQVFDEL